VYPLLGLICIDIVLIFDTNSLGHLIVNTLQYKLIRCNLKLSTLQKLELLILEKSLDETIL